VVRSFHFFPSIFYYCYYSSFLVLRSGVQGRLAQVEEGDAAGDAGGNKSDDDAMEE